VITRSQLVFIGIDPIDPHAVRQRPCTRAILAPDLRCVFNEWEYNESGKGMIPASVGDARFIVAVDGPQGLAGSPDRTMRACERELGAAGKSPYNFPPSGHLFAGFVCGSVRLFHAMYKSGDFRLYGDLGVERSHANLIEVYPGAAWQVLAGKERLPRKTLKAGREVRLELLKEQGLTFPGVAPQVIPTHDDLDAAMAAYIAYLFVNARTTDCGEPPVEDVQHAVLREGFIVQPIARGEKWH